MDGSLDVPDERRSAPRAIFHIFLLLPLLLVATPKAAHAGMALNQLCGAAGMGAGCINALHPPTPTMGGGMASGGGMFGGMMGTIVGSMLIDALTSGPDAPAAGEQAAQSAQAQAEAARIQAFQKAIQEQQRIQQEREDKLLSQLKDRPASQIIGGTQDLTVMEPMRAEAGAPFDGNALTSPDDTWMNVDDPWYSPPAADASPPAAGSQPIPIGNQSLGQPPAQEQPIQCMGQLCAFPPGAPAVTIRTIPPPDPGTATPPAMTVPNVGSVASETHEMGDRMVWAVDQRFGGTTGYPTAEADQIEIASFGSTVWAQAALPGMQREIAKEGRGIYRQVAETVLNQTFQVMSDAFAGRWEEALEESDNIGESVKDSLLSEYKMSRLILSGDWRGAGDEAGSAFLDKAKETAADVLKDKLPDLLRGPEWEKEGARASGEVIDHWLRKPYRSE